jgi:hypothetical protein
MIALPVLVAPCIRIIQARILANCGEQVCPMDWGHARRVVGDNPRKFNKTGAR